MTYDITNGCDVSYIEEYCDGFQARFTNKDQRSNPFKQNQDSGHCKFWKQGFANASSAISKGHTFGVNVDLIRSQYNERHPKRTSTKKRNCND